MEKGKIIILNGASSSGKTTLAKALQDRMDDLTYILSLDDFLTMIGLKKYEESIQNRINLYETMQYTIQLLSDRGRNVIVDTVYLDGEYDTAVLKGFACLLISNPVLFLRIECEVQELERRERQRGDRPIGQAKYQSEHMHGYNIYDAIIDTSKSDLDVCIEQILVMLDRQNEWVAFNKLANISIS